MSWKELSAIVADFMQTGVPYMVSNKDKFAYTAGILRAVEKTFMGSPTTVPTTDEHEKCIFLYDHLRDLQQLVDRALMYKAKALDTTADKMTMTDVPYIVGKIAARLVEITSSGVIEEYAKLSLGSVGDSLLQQMRQSAKQDVADPRLM